MSWCFFSFYSISLISFFHSFHLIIIVSLSYFNASYFSFSKYFVNFSPSLTFHQTIIVIISDNQSFFKDVSFFRLFVLKVGQPRPLFSLFLFFSNTNFTENCRLQQDSNSDAKEAADGPLKTCIAGNVGEGTFSLKTRLRSNLKQFESERWQRNPKQDQSDQIWRNFVTLAKINFTFAIYLRVYLDFGKNLNLLWHFFMPKGKWPNIDAVQRQGDVCVRRIVG